MLSYLSLPGFVLAHVETTVIKIDRGMFCISIRRSMNKEKQKKNMIEFDEAQFRRRFFAKHEVTTAVPLVVLLFTLVCRIRVISVIIP